MTVVVVAGVAAACVFFVPVVAETAVVAVV